MKPFIYAVKGTRTPYLCVDTGTGGIWCFKWDFEEKVWGQCVGAFSAETAKVREASAIPEDQLRLMGVFEGPEFLQPLGG